MKAPIGKPVEEDHRLRVPCTSLPGEVARIHAAGARVMRMEKDRDRRSTTLDYLLTIAPSGCWRWLESTPSA